MKLALSANVREWWTRTAAKRRKNAVHGASRGRGADREPALEGRKTNVAYVRQHPSPSYLSTRERHPLIKPEFRSELFAYLGGIVGEMHGTALIISGTADHVHMLVRTRPARAPAELARVVKTNSSRWVREKWSPNFEWQTGYGVFSVSESNVAAVMKYIASQEEHNKKHSFQDEFLAFLKKNGIARTRNMFGTSLFRPSGACVVSALYPRLAPWAAFFRRFAALQFHANFGCAPSVRLIAAQETRGIRTARSGPSLGKRKNASLGMTLPKSDVDHTSRRQASFL